MGRKITGILAAILLFAGFMAVSGPRFLGFNNLPEYGKAPAFKLVSQTSEGFDINDLKNKIWTFNFFLTRCEGPCPIIGANLSKASKLFEGDDSVVFVSTTTDPEFDKPEVLAEYAKALGVTSPNWKFLTGSKAQIDNLANVGFKLGVGENPQMHSKSIVLVDQQGTIRGFYDGTVAEEVTQLQDDIRILQKNNS